jgi:hypothetical protein
LFEAEERERWKDSALVGAKKILWKKVRQFLEGGRLFLDQQFLTFILIGSQL